MSHLMASIAGMNTITHWSFNAEAELITHFGNVIIQVLEFIFDIHSVIVLHCHYAFDQRSVKSSPFSCEAKDMEGLNGLQNIA